MIIMYYSCIMVEKMFLKGREDVLLIFFYSFFSFLSLYLTTFEAVKNALWLDNRGRKMLKTQATAIPKYGNIVTSGV